MTNENNSAGNNSETTLGVARLLARESRPPTGDVLRECAHARTTGTPAPGQERNWFRRRIESGRARSPVFRLSSFVSSAFASSSLPLPLFPDFFASSLSVFFGVVTSGTTDGDSEART